MARFEAYCGCGRHQRLDGGLLTNAEVKRRKGDWYAEHTGMGHESLTRRQWETRRGAAMVLEEESERREFGPRQGEML